MKGFNMLTQEEHDIFYGYTPEMTEEERRERTRQIMRAKAWNNDLDEDTPDSEAMDSRYSNAYEEYKDEAVQTLNAK